MLASGFDSSPCKLCSVNDRYYHSPSFAISRDAFYCIPRMVSPHMDEIHFSSVPEPHSQVRSMGNREPSRRRVIPFRKKTLFAEFYSEVENRRHSSPFHRGTPYPSLSSQGMSSTPLHRRSLHAIVSANSLHGLNLRYCGRRVLHLIRLQEVAGNRHFESIRRIAAATRRPSPTFSPYLLFIQHTKRMI